MCGIGGVYNVRSTLERETLVRMAMAIAHRGPDDDGYYFSGAASLGLLHRRLSIIDLSDTGHQPMWDAQHRACIIYNAEVYNYKEILPELQALGYRFVGTSDTEVVLNAYLEWGPDCLSRFNGMFALAIWDEQRQRLFLARDRMGIKPMYYWYDPTTQSIVFASEIKALLQDPRVPRQPNLEAIAEYGRFMYSTGDKTWFAGIQQLPPGHYAELGPDTNGLQVRRWWDLPEGEDAVGERSEAEYVAELRELLTDAVRLHLRSDVPVGAHLSGGLDSSSVVALASRWLEGEGAGPLETFSGAFAEGAAYDERPYIRAVADMYHTDHHEIIPKAEDFPELLPKLVWHMDYPSVGAGLYPQYHVCKLTAASHVKVVNGGQGGDELFAGYFRYVPPYLRTQMASLRRNPAAAARLLADMLRVAVRQTLREVALNSGRRRLASEGALGLLNPTVQAMLPPRNAGPNPGSNPLQRALYWDLRNYLPALLHVEDRTSMSVSLESRVPLLDYRIVELSASIPAALKLRGLESKRIMRRAVAPLLPAAIVARKDKKGFPTPIDQWFGGSLRGWLTNTLTDLSPTARELINTGYVGQLLREHGHTDHSRALWMALNIALWCELYIDGDPTVGLDEKRAAPMGVTNHAAPKSNRSKAAVSR